MKQETTKDLNELCAFLSEIGQLCERYSHIQKLELFKSIKTAANAGHRVADKIVNDRISKAYDLHNQKSF